MKKKLRIMTLIIAIFVLLAGQTVFGNKHNDNTSSAKRVYLDENTFYYEVPDDFDMANASDAGLKAYWIPEKPKDPTELKKWKKEVAGAKWVRPEIEDVPDGLRFGNRPDIISDKDLNRSINSGTSLLEQIMQFVDGSIVIGDIIEEFSMHIYRW